MTITGTDHGEFDPTGPTTTITTPAPDPPSAGSTVTVMPTESVPTTDIWVVRLVVIGLLAIALTVIVAQAVLSIKGTDSLPDQLLTLGAVAVGSLGTMLASTRSTRS